MGFRPLASRVGVDWNQFLTVRPWFPGRTLRFRQCVRGGGTLGPHNVVQVPGLSDAYREDYRCLFVRGSSSLLRHSCRGAGAGESLVGVFVLVR